jgi:SAM-dependent methyltransferase
MPEVDAMTSTPPHSPASDFRVRRTAWNQSVVVARTQAAESSHAYKVSLQRLMAGIIPAGCSVLQVGCGRGDLLASLSPSVAVGVEPSPELADQARQLYPSMRVCTAPLDEFHVEGSFDYILVADALIDCFDVDDLLKCVARCACGSTRVVITNYSQLWRPVLRVARALGLARPRFGDTWFSPADLRAALGRCGFEVITASPEVLLPVPVPVAAPVANRFLARLPLLGSLCLHHVFVARKIPVRERRSLGVSVVVPARNEVGHVARLMREIPPMGAWTEVIFVEGNSTDGTLDALDALVRERGDPRIRLIRQRGKGKGDAVRAGFAEARGDVLMILDADLTVPAETLPSFYEVVASGHADFANGTRLVYAMDGKAMRFLNLVANQLFAHAFTYVLGQPVRDTLCGTKVMHRDLYQRIAANRAYFGDFDPFGDFDLLLGAARLNAKIADVPIRYRERVYGMTNISRFRHGLLLFRMLGVAALKLKFR